MSDTSEGSGQRADGPHDRCAINVGRVIRLLLEQAVIAEAAAAKLAADHPDRAFYEGKRFGALFFAFNVLPGVAAKAQMIAREDRTALDIPIAAFAPA